jgi:uridine kinase
MHTIIRDVNTPRDDFIFYSERLSTLIIETYVLVKQMVKCGTKVAYICHSYLRGLSHLPFKDETVITPIGHEYNGKAFKGTVSGIGRL